MADEKVKPFPCDELDYCPYGCLVEYFPLRGKACGWNDLKIDWIKPKKEGRSCSVFGHDCPVDYVAEGNRMTEEKEQPPIIITAVKEKLLLRMEVTMKGEEISRRYEIHCPKIMAGTIILGAIEYLEKTLEEIIEEEYNNDKKNRS